MASAPSAAVARAAAASAAAVPADKLDLLRLRAAQARDLRVEIDDLLSRAKEKTDLLNSLFRDALPELMLAAGTDVLGVPASGNCPGIDLELVSYYSASIAAKWSAERKEAAYAVLRSRKAEGLIKATVEVRLPKGNISAAKKIVALAKKLRIKGAVVDLRQAVHKSTLSAWLKELYEDHCRSLTARELEAIGGSVGQVVRIRTRDDEGTTNGDDE